MQILYPAADHEAPQEWIEFEKFWSGLEIVAVCQGDKPVKLRWTPADENINVERCACDAPDVSCKSPDDGVRNGDVTKKPLEQPEGVINDVGQNETISLAAGVHDVCVLRGSESSG